MSADQDQKCRLPGLRPFMDFDFSGLAGCGGYSVFARLMRFTRQGAAFGARSRTEELPIPSGGIVEVPCTMPIQGT